jgi:hypothetical protein
VPPRRRWNTNKAQEEEQRRSSLFCCEPQENREMMMALWLAAGYLLVLGAGVEGIGVSYGMIANNLPPPDKVVVLY